VRYLVTKRKNGKEYHFWQPKARFKVKGIWKDCPFPARPVKSIDEANDLYDKLKRWRKGDESPAAKDGTVDWLIGKFKASMTFKDMKVSTQKNYLGHFKEFHPILGDIPVEEVTAAIAYNFCTSFSKNARKPSAIASTGRALFQFARKLDAKYEKLNPFAELGISKPAPRKQVWTHEQEAALGPAALELDRQDLHDAAMIGLYSIQRPQDIRAAAVNSYDGKWWRITQKKTGAVVDIPVFRLPKLKAVLDRLVRSPGSPVMLLCKANGKPFTKETLCKGFREMCDKANIGKEMQFRDFRRTGIVRLGEAGCTPIEIASWSGHDIESVSKILKVYLPTNRTMADHAGQKLETFTSNPRK
jgi:hypothetical protein